MDYKKMWMERKDQLLGIIAIGQAEEDRKLAPGESRDYSLTRKKDEALEQLVILDKLEVAEYYGERKCLVGNAELLDEIRALEEKNRALENGPVINCQCDDDRR